MIDNYTAYKKLEKYENNAKLNKNKEDEEIFHCAKMCIGSIDQIRWERDIAIQQLKELGYSLGEKNKIRGHKVKNIYFLKHH